MEQEYLNKAIQPIFKEIVDSTKVIETNNGGDFEIVRTVRSYNFKFNPFELHKLFNPDGYELSGEITILAHVYLPSVDMPRNMSSDRLFRFTFKDVPILFDSESEEFILNGELNITYIQYIQ